MQGMAKTEMKIRSSNPLLWVLAAGVVGWTASGVFSGMLYWSRSAFVLAYGVLVAAFLARYFRAAGVDPIQQLRRRSVAGIVGGILIGLLLTWNVTSQPGSDHPQGLGFLGALAWLGVFYGAIDALLLSVIPVLSIYGTRSREELRQVVPRVGWGLAALAGSLLVTAMYHVGFAEYRGPALVHPLVGSSII